MLELAGHEGWLAPSMAFSRVLDFVSGDRLGVIPRFLFAATLVVCLTVLVREVWRRGGRIDGGELAATWGWALLLLMLLGPVLLPWYVTWSLPLVWALPRMARTTVLATSVLLAATLWSAEPLRFPGAFQVDTFIGRWVVTPIVLVLLIRSIARPALTGPDRAAVRRGDPPRRRRRRARPSSQSAYPPPPARAEASVATPSVPSPAPSRSSASAASAERRHAERRRGREGAAARPRSTSSAHPAPTTVSSSSTRTAAPAMSPGPDAASSLARRRQRARRTERGGEPRVPAREPGQLQRARPGVELLHHEHDRVRVAGDRRRRVGSPPGRRAARPPASPRRRGRPRRDRARSTRPRRGPAGRSRARRSARAMRGTGPASRGRRRRTRAACPARVVAAIRPASVVVRSSSGEMNDRAASQPRTVGAAVSDDEHDPDRPREPPAAQPFGEPGQPEAREERDAEREREDPVGREPSGEDAGRDGDEREREPGDQEPPREPARRAGRPPRRAGCS